MLTIGELAERTGVPATALRYYDELGLVAPARRESGRRRYAEDAVKQVGVVLFLRDVGFTLEEIRRFVDGDDWRALLEQKLAEIEAQAARLATARVALQHGLDCPAGDPVTCPRFWSIVEERVAQ